MVGAIEVEIVDARRGAIEVEIPAARIGFGAVRQIVERNEQAPDVVLFGVNERRQLKGLTFEREASSVPIRRIRRR